jgi:hypothetical protein
MSYLDSLLLEASSFVSSELNLKIQQSQLKPYSLENWQQFCQTNSFEQSAGGLYVPQSLSAYVNAESPFLIPNIFHEYFGHGLFCEHSQLGQELVEIVQNEGGGNKFLHDEVEPQIQPLGLCSQNIGNYEGFAVWMEALLCEELGKQKIWETKKTSIPQFYQSLHEHFQDSEQKLTRFGFMSQLGFPKHYSDQQVVDVLKHLYRADKFTKVDFVILYGSQKPESDIDLCVVSTNSSTQYFNGWLDLAELNRKDFQQRLTNLDIAITDAMFSGKLIYGEENNFSQLKQNILDTPITKEAIDYNLAKAQYQREHLPHHKDNPRMKKLCLSYIESFSQNAQQLQKGKKLLTLQNLQQMDVK